MWSKCLQKELETMFVFLPSGLIGKLYAVSAFIYLRDSQMFNCDLIEKRHFKKSQFIKKSEEGHFQKYSCISVFVELIPHFTSYNTLHL